MSEQKNPGGSKFPFLPEERVEELDKLILSDKGRIAVSSEFVERRAAEMKKQRDGLRTVEDAKRILESIRVAGDQYIAVLEWAGIRVSLGEDGTLTHCRLREIPAAREGSILFWLACVEQCRDALEAARRESDPMARAKAALDRYAAMEDYVLPLIRSDIASAREAATFDLGMTIKRNTPQGRVGNPPAADYPAEVAVHGAGARSFADLYDQVNLSLRKLHRPEGKRRHEPLEIEPEITDPDPLARLMDAETLASLQKRLTPTENKILKLRIDDHKTPEEIAVELGIERGTVDVNIRNISLKAEKNLKFF